MQKSALLSLVLELPSVRKAIFKLLMQKSVKARSSSDVLMTQFLDPADLNGEIETTSLFHIARDLNYIDWFPPPGSTSASAPFVEIDVVMLIKGRGLLAFELKWESSVGHIDKQMKKEQEALRMLAEYCGVSWTALIAILPKEKSGLAYADAVITIEQLHNIIAENIQVDAGGFAKRLMAEFDVMLKTTPLRMMDWKCFSLDELRAYQTKNAAMQPFVGYNKGLGDLRGLSCQQIYARPHWKIAERPHGTQRPDWYSLEAIKGILDSKLGPLDGTARQC